MVAVDGDPLVEPPGELARGLNVVPSAMPRLHATVDGGLVVGYRIHRQLQLMTYYWEAAAQVLGPDGWLPPITLGGTDATLEEVSLAATAAGVVLATQTDGRLQRALHWSEGFGGRECPYLADHHGAVIWHGVHGAGQVVLTTIPSAGPAATGGVRSATIVSTGGGRRGAGRPGTGARGRVEIPGFQLYWGDLHRHSLISRCTSGDEPSLEDFYRSPGTSMSTTSGRSPTMPRTPPPTSGGASRRSPTCCTCPADVLGVSGRAMLAALVAGERDPLVLAELAKGRLRRKIPALRQALRGRFREHHALLIGLALDHIAHLEAAIARLDERVDALFATHTSEAGLPFARARDRLDTITGVGKRAAETIIAEIGVDMARFPTAAHLASWAGVAPGNNITGGKRGSGKTTHGDVWLLDILTQCAWAAAHTRDTYLSAQFWRLARRIGKKKAAIAVAHSILVICWHLLTNDCDYDDLGGDYFTRRNTDRQRDRLIKQLHTLGYRVTLDKAA